MYDDTCLMTKEPLVLETMKTKLRLPSPTSLTDKSEKLLASLDESAGMDFMYSMSVFSFRGLNSEKFDMVTWFEQWCYRMLDFTFGRETLLCLLLFYSWVRKV